MTFDKTSDAVAEVAQHVCDRFATGYRGGENINGVHIEYRDIARCSEFVRECCEAAAGTGDHSLPYFGSDARDTERILDMKGKRVAVPHVGDIVCFNKGTGTWGHIGIVRDGSTFCENTSSTDRGPGFVVSRFAEIGWSRVTGYYRILPARAAAPPQTTPVKVIDHATGAVLEVLQVVEGGWHPEQGKLYVSGGK